MKDFEEGSLFPSVSDKTVLEKFTDAANRIGKKTANFSIELTEEDFDCIMSEVLRKGDGMLKATLIGKEETFGSLGIKGNYEIELESLIITLRKQLEKEYYETGKKERKISEISETANAGTEDFRSEALLYADHHPAFPLNWSKNKLNRDEMNER